MFNLLLTDIFHHPILWFLLFPLAAVFALIGFLLFEGSRKNKAVHIEKQERDHGV